MEDWFGIFEQRDYKTELIYRCLALEDARNKLNDLFNNFQKIKGVDHLAKDFSGNAFEFQIDDKSVRYFICGINEL